MDINNLNPLNMQLAYFARTLEWKMKKQKEHKHSEYLKIKELTKAKEKPMTITNLYYTGQLVGSSCIHCHPPVTSIFQKSFIPLTLKDLLHRKCNKYVKDVTSSKQDVETFHQSSPRGTLTYYFMRAASWCMYQIFSFQYKGVLIHSEQIDCIKQAQDTGSTILFFLPTNTPDVWTLCSLYFALYFSGLRPPELRDLDHLSGFPRFLFSCLGCLHPGPDPASIITHSVASFYSNYVNYVIDDLYVVPVSVAFDVFIHVNLATPYALSELEIQYSSVELEDDNDVDDVRDIDAHVKTDCFHCIPITALCFVAYVMLANRTGHVISEDTLYESVQRMRAECIREKVFLNFKGTTENIVKCALDLLSPHLTSRRSSGSTEYVIDHLDKLVHCAMGLVFKKLLLCLVTAVVYSFCGDVLITSSQDDVQFDLNVEKSKDLVSAGIVKHTDISSKSLQVLKQVEKKLNVKALKYCQNREDDINKTIGELVDWEVLLSTDRGLLEEERWCRNLAKSMDMDDENEEAPKRETRTYNVKVLNKSPLAKQYLCIATSLNSL